MNKQQKIDSSILHLAKMFLQDALIASHRAQQNANITLKEYEEVQRMLRHRTDDYLKLKEAC